jgi:hypothetical protein
MNNLLNPSNYEPEPNAINTSIQKGGRGYHHKKACKCPLCKKCKKRGGSDNYDDVDIETGPPEEESYKIDIKDEHDIESGVTSNSKDNSPSSNLDTKNDFNFASKQDYDALDDLDDAEKGLSGPFKVGGSRRRKRRNSKKTKKVKGRKTRRNKRKATLKKGKH